MLFLQVLLGLFGRLRAGVTLFTYAVHHQVDWMIGMPLAVGGLMSISWGVRIAHAMPERLPRGLFCGFLVFCVVTLAVKV